VKSILPIQCALADAPCWPWASQVAEQGRQLFASETWETLGEALHLPARELQILQGIFDDLKESAIAAELGISPHTVNTYLRRLYRKLGVSSRAQLIVRVVAAYLTVNARDTSRMTHQQVTCRFLQGSRTFQTVTRRPPGNSSCIQEGAPS
jgi:DNA-binding CsgD family transcriptional regulator